MNSRKNVKKLPNLLNNSHFFFQDFDGWTPLHAAAHWAQREACEILCENYANMDIKNYVGQTVSCQVKNEKWYFFPKIVLDLL